MGKQKTIKSTQECYVVVDLTFPDFLALKYGGI
jgi:hypothetical protein